MSIALDPITPILGVGTRVPITIQPANLAAVKITNSSPYTLKINGPDASYNWWLDPWLEDLVHTSGGAGLFFTPMLGGVPHFISLSNIVKITLYYADEEIPSGAWPIALLRDVSAIEFAPNPTNLIANNGSGFVMQSVAVTGATSIIAAITPGAGQYAYIIGYDLTVKHAAAATSTTATVSGVQQLPSPPERFVEGAAGIGLVDTVRYPFALQALVIGDGISTGSISVSVAASQAVDMTLQLYGMIA